MQRGVYEQLLSAGLQQRLAELDRRQWRIATADVDGAEQAGVLADHFARVLCRVLGAAHETGGADEATRLHNALLDQLHQASQGESLAGVFTDSRSKWRILRRSLGRYHSVG